MISLQELLGKKVKYENEKLFIEAKIAVVDEMIADENAKCVEPANEEIVEEPIENVNVVEDSI